MKTFTALLPLLIVIGAATIARAAPAPDHRLFTEILATHVREGLVDYAALKTDERLPRYLAQLAATDPAQLPDDTARLAFWLNAYNAYTLQLIVEKQPAKSITEIGRGGLVLGTVFKTTAWDIPLATIGGKKFTLNQIEHETIRVQFKDARAHYALNCASGSCPVLRPEAFEADRLNAQLDDQAQLFLRDSARNQFDLPAKIARLSKIFSWYSADFGPGKHGALLAAAKYAPDAVRRSIEQDPAAWRVEFLAYDWSLNTTPKATGAAAPAESKSP